MGTVTGRPRRCGVQKAMPEPRKLTPTAPAQLSREGRLALANRLYREFYTRCFWHRPRDLVVTEDLIPLVIKGLRQHGGRRGFVLAEELRRRTADDRSVE
jgi:hypothetical protein